MTNISVMSMEDGCNRLKEIIMSLSPLGQLSNEAETRFHFIDRFLKECLGWESVDIHVEMAQDGQFADYEIGKPRALILEAKKSTQMFNFPAQRLPKNNLYNISDLLGSDENLESAIKQCQDYCIRRGVQYAVVSNGCQIIIFLASRDDGVAPLRGKAIALNGESAMVDGFKLLWQTISPGAVNEKRLNYILSSSTGQAVPRKISSYINDYAKFKYRSNLQDDLRTVANLLLEDLATVDSVEKQFYERCYCESGALSSYAIMSKEIIKTRYSALFNRQEQAPSVTPVNDKSNIRFDNSSDVVAEALAKRPIVLIGDVGVGKTSFLRNLMLVRAYEEFNQSLYLYFDLGSHGALEEDLITYLIFDMEKQLLKNYGVDVYEKKFVLAVYNNEVNRFRNGIWGELYQSDKSRYEEKLLSYLEEKLKNKAMHLQMSIRHISRGRNRPVVIILDNADQRDFDLQQSAFVIAQNFSKDWDATVFIAVRPQTFHHSKRAGSLSAYPPKVFTISPPRPELLIRKRLCFALDMAEGRFPVESLHGIKLNLKALSLFISALLHSLEKNKEIYELLSNITGGNMRAVVELITKFISTPNVDTDKIVTKMEKGGYLIPLHEFSKVAILGDYTYYHAQSSIAANLFDVCFSGERLHFLSCMMLGYLGYDSSAKNADGFLETEKLIKEMQDWGYFPDAINDAIRRLANKRLIETTERVTFEEDARSQLIGNIPHLLRLTSIGSYHIKKWISAFAYLDAMVFDTPIFRVEYSEKILPTRESFNILDRYERTVAFRDYLSMVWGESDLNPPYFNWLACVACGENTFESVAKVINKTKR